MSVLWNHTGISGSKVKWQNHGNKNVEASEKIKVGLLTSPDPWSGWIHAVYTPEDSLVFGGNFLHSYAIEKQIRVAQIEETTKVPQKFRFPFFTELQWYALDKYAFALLGKTNMEFDDQVARRSGH